MIANTRWMTASDLADRLNVHPNAIRNAFSTKGRCSSFRIQRREVKPGEDFGRSKFVFRGIDGALKQAAAPVTDRPPTTVIPAVANDEAKASTDDIKASTDDSRAAAEEPTASTDDTKAATNEANVTAAGETPWMRQDDLAKALGCRPKTVRNTWEKNTRVNQFRVERRAVQPNEDFGKTRYVYRAIPDDSPRRRRTSNEQQLEHHTPWMSAAKLADTLDVHPNSIRAAVDRDIRAAGNIIERRPASPDEVSDKRIRFLFRALGQQELPETPAPLAEAPPTTHDAQPTTEQAAPEQAAPEKPRRGRAKKWLPCAKLAEQLEVHPNAIRLAHDNQHLCQGHRIERRRATPKDGVDGRTRYLFRAIPDQAPVTEPAPAPQAAPAPTPQAAPATAEPSEPAIVETVTAKPALTAAPASDTQRTELLQQAAEYSLDHPEDAPSVFRFLKTFIEA